MSSCELCKCVVSTSALKARLTPFVMIAGGKLEKGRAAGFHCAGQPQQFPSRHADSRVCGREASVQQIFGHVSIPLLCSASECVCLAKNIGRPAAAVDPAEHYVMTMNGALERHEAETHGKAN